MERDIPWFVSSPPPQPQYGDEAPQWTCVGLLSYYTWATPVTVKATPSAVSTSSQRGCNVIISREILPRNAKQGHGSGGPGPGVWKSPVPHCPSWDRPKAQVWRSLQRYVAGRMCKDHEGWQGRNCGSRGSRKGGGICVHMFPVHHPGLNCGCGGAGADGDRESLGYSSVCVS